MKGKGLFALVTTVLLMNGAFSPGDSPRFGFLGGPAAQAWVQVDIGFFYNELAPYGYWDQSAPYGWVWYPSVSADWRPYTLGNWVFTDDFGWTWISSEPWGWIPFHYGRWFYDDDYGRWAWVPGTTWGPAWVAWRIGKGFIGWAPLPPGEEFGPRVGFSAPDLEVGVSRQAWCFVPEPVFLSPRIERLIVPPPRNITIINNTVNVTNYTVINDRVVNRSIDVHRFESDAQTRVIRYQVTEVDRPVVAGTQLQGRQVTLFRPQVKKETVVTPPLVSGSMPRGAAPPIKNHPANLPPNAVQREPGPELQGQDLRSLGDRQRNEQPSLVPAPRGVTPLGEQPRNLSPGGSPQRPMPGFQGQNSEDRVTKQRDDRPTQDKNRQAELEELDKQRQRGEMERARQQTIQQQEQERLKQQQAIEAQAAERQRQRGEMERARQQTILQQQEQERLRHQQAVGIQSTPQQHRQEGRKPDCNQQRPGQQPECR